MKIFDKTKQFLSEIKVELAKVNWPDRKSVVGSTGVVLLTTVAMLVFLWVADILFSTAFKLILFR